MIVALVVVLCVLAGLVVVKLGILDPYRPGSAHAATMERNQVSACTYGPQPPRVGFVVLEGRSWRSETPLPEAWPERVDGELRITDHGGTFAARGADINLRLVTDRGVVRSTGCILIG